MVPRKTTVLTGYIHSIVMADRKLLFSHYTFLSDHLDQLIINSLEQLPKQKQDFLHSFSFVKILKCAILCCFFPRSPHRCARCFYLVAQLCRASRSSYCSLQFFFENFIAFDSTFLQKEEAADAFGFASFCRLGFVSSVFLYRHNTANHYSIIRLSTVISKNTSELKSFLNKYRIYQNAQTFPD